MAIPKDMEAALQGRNVVRLAGSNRYKTNLAILAEAGPSDEEVLICNGTSFADSLSASAAGKPILMVSSSLTVGQKEYLASSSGKFVIIGGENAITPTLEAQLQQYGTTERLGGSNRYKTSVLVAQRFFPKASQAVLAYGHNFPDGLCGGPLAYVLNAPLVLTRNENLAVTDEYASQTGISSGAVLGGPALISETTAIQILYP